MESTLKVYDVFDNKNNLNSQVLLNDIGFEIPSNYYFDNNTVNIHENKFQLINDKNRINLKCGVFNKDDFDKVLTKYNNFIVNDFQNYRNQKIYEIISNQTIKVLGHDDNVFFELSSDIKRYTQEYFELYYIAFSFCKIEDNEYDNITFQKNNYCILKNGKYIYDKYDINLIYEKPNECVKTLNSISFNNYISNNDKYDSKLKNNYIKNDFDYIVEKIEKFKNIKDDDNFPLDILEEN